MECGCGIGGSRLRVRSQVSTQGDTILHIVASLGVGLWRKHIA